MFSVGMWDWNVPYQKPEWWMPRVSRMTGAGVGHWVLKITDGTALFNGDALGPAVAYARAQGLHVWVWGYVRDARYADPAAQGTLLGRRAEALGANGAVIDVESEWLNPDASAAPLVAALRNQFSGGPLYASSYSTTTLHSEFPFKQFTALCDGWMPQVYQTPQDQWAERSLAEFRALGKDVILTGIGSAQMGTVADTQAFLGACRQAEVVCNLWVYEQMTEPMWEAVSNATNAAAGV